MTLAGAQLIPESVNAHRPVTEKSLGTKPWEARCTACGYVKRGKTERVVRNAYYREHLYPLVPKRGETP